MPSLQYKDINDGKMKYVDPSADPVAQTDNTLGALVMSSAESAAKIIELEKANEALLLEKEEDRKRFNDLEEITGQLLMEVASMKGGV